MQISALGHLVLKVRQLDRSVDFYQRVLGLRLVARQAIRGTPMAFFSIDANHHDLALIELGPGAVPAAPDAVGLAHFALKIGERVDQLRQAREHLRAHGVQIDRTVDHRVSKSLYVRDPDGHVVELYVDADPRLWADDPSTVAHSESFTIE